MSQSVAKTEGQAFQQSFARIAPSVQKVLPSHISFEQFERVVMMAVQKDPKLLQTDQRTLLLECQKAAADGLKPDGREGVLVRRWNKDLGCEAATWQPMVAGLMKLARNSGEIVSINAHIVYKGEKFSVILGDEERIEHERDMALVDTAPPIAVYAVVKLKSGELVREVLTAGQVEKIRDVNKYWAKGPWGGPFKEEMWKKSAIRRVYKRLPSSTDRETEARLQSAVERVDDVIDHQTDEPIDLTAPPRPTSKLDALEHSATEAVDEETGEITETSAADGSGAAQDDAGTIFAALAKCTKPKDIADMQNEKALGPVIDKLKASPAIHKQVMDRIEARRIELVTGPTKGGLV